jgi:hypothetical protein
VQLRITGNVYERSPKSREKNMPTQTLEEFVGGLEALLAPPEVAPKSGKASILLKLISGLVVIVRWLLTGARQALWMGWVHFIGGMVLECEGEDQCPLCKAIAAAPKGSDSKIRSRYRRKPVEIMGAYLHDFVCTAGSDNGRRALEKGTPKLLIGPDGMRRAIAVAVAKVVGPDNVKQAIDQTVPGPLLKLSVKRLSDGSERTICELGHDQELPEDLSELPELDSVLVQPEGEALEKALAAIEKTYGPKVSE